MTTVRIICVMCFLALPAGLSPSAVEAGTADQKYGAIVGLYTDAGHSDCDVTYSAGFFPFEMWVWWYPLDVADGMHCAEFMISYPANVIASTVTANPAITASYGGSLSTGIGVCFGECHTGWTWTHHQQCFLWNGSVPEPTSIQILPYPEYGALEIQITDCTLRPTFWPAMVLTPLYLNQSGTCPTLDQFLPRIVGVTATAFTVIRAQFDMCVEEDYITPLHFVLHNKANPTDSIKVAQAARVADDAYELVLQKAMVDSTTYVLLAREAYWSCAYEFRNYSEFEFPFLVVTATEETSWGAIKALFKD